MSYDIMVFEPTAAPRERGAFMRWYEVQTQWSENHGYNDPSVCSPALQRWFAQMAKVYPPLNGPLASGDLDEVNIADHCCGRNVVYSAFSGTVAAVAYRTMKDLAIEHRVGFFAASESEGELIFPEV